MTDLRLIPRVKAMENGRFRPEVRIVDPAYGTEDVFLGAQSVATHALALEAALRLVAAATVEEPVTGVALSVAFRFGRRRQVEGS
jgi:hypothetical protein